MHGTYKKNKVICMLICLLLLGGLYGCSIPNIGKGFFMKKMDLEASKSKEVFSISSDEKKDDSVKCIEEFIRALDSHDKEALRNCFSEYVRKNDNELYQEIDELFHAYDGPTDSWRWAGSSTESYSSDPKENREYITCTAVLKSKGKNYYLYVEYTTLDMSDRGRQGLCCADFTTPEVQAAISDGRRELTSYKGENMWKGEDHYKLHVTTDHKGEYLTRRIAGEETIYTQTETKYSSKDFVDFANENGSVKDLRELFGQENAWKKNMGDLYYKVTDDDDLYVCIHYMDGSAGQVVKSITLVNEENNYIDSLYFRDGK